MYFKVNNKVNLSVQYNGSTNGSLEAGWYTEQVKQSTHMMLFTRAECVFLITALLILSLVTVALNVITIITFVSHRQVRKRSTYILISLAVADMLVGAVSAPLHLADVGDFPSCELWKWKIGRSYLSHAVYTLFPVASMSHLVAVSLERLYVILYPFKYRSLKDKAYGTAIAIVWLVPTLMIALVFALHSSHKIYFFVWSSYSSVALVTICVCYLIIFIKIRCSSLPRRHGAANKERKLTITLFIVTAVSLLTWLPSVVCTFAFFGGIFYEMSRVTVRRINEVVIILYLANSLVNPIVYTIRMSEFRKAAPRLLCKKRRRRVKRIRVPEKIVAFSKAK